MKDIWKHNLNNYHAIQLRSKELAAQHPSSRDSDPAYPILDILNFNLAIFLSKFYVELHRYDNKKPAAQSLLLRTINDYFLVLKNKIGKTHLGSLSFARLPYEHIDYLNHTQLTEAVDVISSNLNKLDQFLSLLLTNEHEQKIKSRRLMHYTFGAIGISVLSLWLLRDGRLSGIISNWVLETKDSTVRFLRDNVEQPLMYIRDGLVEAYSDSNTSRGVIESKRLQATSDSLHGMLLDFGELTGLKFPPNASDEEMYNIVEKSFGEQRSLFGGVSAHSMLSQLLKLNLEVEKTIPNL
uniref:protein DGS1, mitochondrial-like n=1 Tax=Erigeron canadensis TaxID=72917 RepID=UPI001CB9A350|nr:protein DGS1, mitochondrial-like [Erigeron canadensis]